MFTKAETNNAVFVKLRNVRKHPNADRLKLAAVLGTTVVVSLEAKEGDLMIYFDSNLQLMPEYLKANNLYSKSEMNADPDKKGYFGKNGKVRAQRFRGEVSNGFVTTTNSLCFCGFFGIVFEGLEFNTVNGVKICQKYVVPVKHISQEHGKRKPRKAVSEHFKQHWDTKQFMRQSSLIPVGSLVHLEEKVHGTSGRTGYHVRQISRPWWKFWVPKVAWDVVSGTRRINNVDYHIPRVRKEIESKLAPNLRAGETLYYEIAGFCDHQTPVQKGFTYGCKLGEYIVVLYRVTYTTLDGYVMEAPREAVYQRAIELGLQAPILLGSFFIDSPKALEMLSCTVTKLCGGKTNYNDTHIQEGVVIWYTTENGSSHCLKHKSEEFLMLESKQRDNGKGDVEDVL